MINRAVVQPDPAIFTGMVADTMAAAEASASVEDLFLRLEDLGIMLRVDRSAPPTMAKAPTLASGSWSSCAPSRTSYAMGTSSKWTGGS